MVSAEPRGFKENNLGAAGQNILSTRINSKLQQANKSWEGEGGRRRNRKAILFIPTWLTQTESMRTEFVCRSAWLAGCLACKLSFHVLGCTKGHRIIDRPRWVKYLGLLLVYYRVPYTNTLFVTNLRNLIILTAGISLLRNQLRDLYQTKSCLKIGTSLCRDTMYCVPVSELTVRQETNTIISELVKNRLLCLFQKCYHNLNNSRPIYSIFLFFNAKKGTFPTCTFIFVKEQIAVYFFIFFFFNKKYCWQEM
jgi:hypothetical protein